MLWKFLHFSSFSLCQNMGSTLSKIQNTVSQQDRTILTLSVFLVSLITITVIVFGSSSSYVKYFFKRFLRIQIRRRLMDPRYRRSETDAFVSYYQSSLCHLQKVNNELLAKILQKNHSCAFFVDQSMNFKKKFHWLHTMTIVIISIE
jgi:hypothetical protein